jgi:hypothetical protein
MGMPPFDIRSVSIADVASLFTDHHAYASTGNLAVYAFGVFEDDRAVAAYLWQPPAPGARL